MRKCNKCGDEKSLDAFPRHSKNKRRNCCKVCYAAYFRKWRKENPEAMRRHARTAAIQKYGISEASYDEMVAAQKGLCRICGKDNGNLRLAIDHCHRTGKVRGLLCNQCNRAIGMLGDDAALLRRAADYLSGCKGMSLSYEPSAY